jgi:hypothetical protein
MIARKEGQEYALIIGEPRRKQAIAGRPRRSYEGGNFLDAGTAAGAAGRPKRPAFFMGG